MGLKDESLVYLRDCSRESPHTNFCDSYQYNTSIYWIGICVDTDLTELVCIG